jgi:hypothetical protein
VHAEADALDLKICDVQRQVVMLVRALDAGCIDMDAAEAALGSMDDFLVGLIAAVRLLRTLADSYAAYLGVAVDDVLTELLAVVVERVTDDY